jgi:hypothetical protein
MKETNPCATNPEYCNTAEDTFWYRFVNQLSVKIKSIIFGFVLILAIVLCLYSLSRKQILTNANKDSQVEQDNNE